MLYHRNNFMENEKLRDNLTLSKYVAFIYSRALKNESIALDGVYPKILFLIPIMLTQTLCHTFCHTIHLEEIESQQEEVCIYLQSYHPRYLAGKVKHHHNVEVVSAIHTFR